MENKIINLIFSLFYVKKNANMRYRGILSMEMFKCYTNISNVLLVSIWISFIFFSVGFIWFSKKFKINKFNRRYLLGSGKFDFIGCQTIGFFLFFVRSSTRSRAEQSWVYIKRALLKGKKKNTNRRNRNCINKQMKLALKPIDMNRDAHVYLPLFYISWMKIALILPIKSTDWIIKIVLTIQKKKKFFHLPCKIAILTVNLRTVKKLFFFRDNYAKQIIICETECKYITNELQLSFVFFLFRSIRFYAASN